MDSWAACCTKFRPAPENLVSLTLRLLCSLDQKDHLFEKRSNFGIALAFRNCCCGGAGVGLVGGTDES
jgi:hypothetical protein